MKYYVSTINAIILPKKKIDMYSIRKTSDKIIGPPCHAEVFLLHHKPVHFCLKTNQFYIIEGSGCRRMRHGERKERKDYLEWFIITTEFPDYRYKLRGKPLFIN